MFGLLKWVLSNNIDLRLINFCQKVFVRFLEYSNLGCAFTENMKIVSMHICKGSNDLVVS